MEDVCDFMTYHKFTRSVPSIVYKHPVISVVYKHPDYDYVRYLKKSRPRRDLYMFNTYFYSILEEALSTPVCLLCSNAILILYKLKKYMSLIPCTVLHELA